MLSTLRGRPCRSWRRRRGSSLPTSTSPVIRIRFGGRVSAHATSQRNRSTRKPATSLPRWGVATKTTRSTKGSGVMNRERCRMARVSSETPSSSKGVSLTLSQNRVPLSTTVSFARRPPWLWPIRTTWRSAGSVPSGSSSATVFVSVSRRRPAEYRMGIARVVGEEPELDARRDARIRLELVDEVGPPGRARGGPVDEHDRHAPRPVRGTARREPARSPGSSRRGSARISESHTGRIVQRVGERRARLELEGDGAAVDHGLARGVLRVELERPRAARPWPTPSRTSSSRRKTVTGTLSRGGTRLMVRRDTLDRAQARDQRRAEPGLLVAVPQPPDLDVARRAGTRRAGGRPSWARRPAGRSRADRRAGCAPRSHDDVRRRA